MIDLRRYIFDYLTDKDMNIRESLTDAYIEKCFD